MIVTRFQKEFVLCHGIEADEEGHRIDQIFVSWMDNPRFVVRAFPRKKSYTFTSSCGINKRKGSYNKVLTNCVLIVIFASRKKQ